jgi:hypothetical protein
MDKVVIFAVNQQDALAECDRRGLEFDDVLWVLNAQLLSGHDMEGVTVIHTDTFKKMPAYAEALHMYGEGAA